MKIIRFFWLALFVVLVAIASFLAEELFFPLKQPFQPGTLEMQIHEDFTQLKKDNQLPETLKDVREVFVLDQRTEKQKNKWQELSQLHFPKSENGKYDLQIEVFNNEGRDRKSITENLTILQLSLFEKDTKNKIWELGRTYSQAPKNPKK